LLNGGETLILFVLAGIPLYFIYRTEREKLKEDDENSE